MAAPPGLRVEAHSDDDGHRVRMVEKVAAIMQQLGTARAMTHAAIVAVAAIGPRTAGSLGKPGTGHTWPKQKKMMRSLLSLWRRSVTLQSQP